MERRSPGRPFRGAPHDALFWRTGGGETYAVRAQALKLVKPAGGKAELYDLARDVGEGTDLAASRPDDLARLQARYDAWNKELVPPRWGNPRAAKPKDKKGE